MQAQAAGSRRPLGTCSMPSQAGQFLPRLAAVGAPEERRVFDAGVHHVRLGERRLEMPHALELPWMRRSVVPLVRAGHSVIGELIADRLPCRAAVARSLYDLTEPPAGLRGVDPVGIGRRSFHVVNLPAAEMRAADIPALTRAVGCENETTFAGTHENSNAAHRASSCATAGSIRKILLTDIDCRAVEKSSAPERPT